jgi:hypothetical protein
MRGRAAQDPRGGALEQAAAADAALEEAEPACVAGANCARIHGYESCPNTWLMHWEARHVVHTPI